MHVEEVESFVDHHLVHAHGEREVVRRVLKERVAADVDFVEVDARQEYGQAERQLVRDEMHFVTALGERDAEFGRDRAGPAVRRITGDADLHSVPPPRHHRSTITSHRGSCGSIRVT